jgi:hypothetical protein
MCACKNNDFGSRWSPTIIHRLTSSTPIAAQLTIFFHKRVIKACSLAVFIAQDLNIYVKFLNHIWLLDFTRY